MKQGFFAIGVFFVLLGAESPEWFCKPSLDANSVYGFGTGSTAKNAKENAMIDLASSLHSSVNAVLQREIKRDDSTLTSSASQKFSINTKEIEFADIQTKNLECIQNQCYAMVEIPKIKLLKQLKQKIAQIMQEMSGLKSPFDYAYKKDVLFPRLTKDYMLYSALGGEGLSIPQSVGEKPIFSLVFEYENDFSKTFKSVLEKTIQDGISKYGNFSPSSDWKLIIRATQENQAVILDVSVKYKEEMIHNASVYDTKKPNISISFFAKRLGVQTYKKIGKWGKS